VPFIAPVPIGLAPQRGAPLVSIRDLSIRYQGRYDGRHEGGTALAASVDGVSFEIGRGEIFGLVGESGSGKSTIGQAILRLLPSSAEVRGGITFEGADILALGDAALRDYRWQQVSMVFQSAMSALNPVATVGDQFVDTLVAHGPWTPLAARERAAELLSMVGLERTVLDAYPHTLSGGMRQRALVALALVLRPRLVILDEPTTALDVVVQKQMLEQLLALKRQLGFAILFISHDLPLLMSVADRVGVLHEGRLVEVGDPERLRAAPKDPYTRMLLSAFPSLPPLGDLPRQVSK
jgi:ABC-type glutathione transport system ATPase component